MRCCLLSRHQDARTKLSFDEWEVLRWLVCCTRLVDMRGRRSFSEPLFLLSRPVPAQLRYPNGTVIVIDNASIHRRSILAQGLRLINGLGRFGTFSLLFTPAHSPECNPVRLSVAIISSSACWHAQPRLYEYERAAAASRFWGGQLARNSVYRSMMPPPLKRFILSPPHCDSARADALPQIESFFSWLKMKCRRSSSQINTAGNVEAAVLAGARSL